MHLCHMITNHVKTLTLVMCVKQSSMAIYNETVYVKLVWAVIAVFISVEAEVYRATVVTSVSAK